MNVIFENVTENTDEVLHEFSKNYGVYNRNFRITMLLGFFVDVFDMIVVLDKKLYLAFVWMLLMALFFLFVFLNGYVLKAKKNFKNMKMLFENRTQSRFTFYEDGFESVAANLDIKSDYSKITGLTETKNLYLLMIEKQALILSKSSFIMGDPKAFQSFILGKCKNAVHK